MDAQATSDAAAGVKQAVEGAFSYDSTKPDDVAKAEQQYLTGSARAQFDKTFAEVRDSAVTTKTQVIETGVAELTANGARVLITAEQHSKRSDGASNQAAALMLVTAAKSNGHWQLSDLSFDPRGAIAQASGSAQGTGAARDAAVDSAKRDGAVLMTVDPATIDTAYDTWEKITAEPLLTQFRTDRAQTIAHLKQSATKATCAPDSPAALTSLSADGKQASALLAARVATAGGQQQPAERQLPIHLDLVWQGNEWKVSAIKPVTAPGS
ncbi:hypothetical protein [Amycolatopsis benzoatilytica]|uniref:hypothetical protein n=1 Tax=Amycolatopsis benzoatilytica TaxID=346045 RepID=UPI0003742E59|nr:hypothetical protein [Amycolatopsis benzoatilytica]